MNITDLVFINFVCNLISVSYLITKYFNLLVLLFYQLPGTCTNKASYDLNCIYFTSINHPLFNL